MRLLLNTVLLAPILLCLPLFSEAAEWSAEPSVRLGSEQNDNIRLAARSRDGVTGFMVSPKLNMAVISDIWRVSGSAELIRKRYRGDSEFDKDDQFYNVFSSYATERSTWQLRGSLTRVEVLTDERISADSGYLQVPRAQDASSISPSWTWMMTELTQLQLSYSLSGVSYVNGASAGLYDYSSRSVTTQLSSKLDPYNQVFFTAGYSIFRVPLTTLESKTATYQVGITHTFSETASGTLSAGRRNTATERDVLQCIFSPLPGICLATINTTIHTKESSSVFDGSLEKQFERIRANATLSRAFSPSGSGGQVLTDSLSIALSRPMTAKLTGKFSATGFKVGTQREGVTSVDQRRYQVEPNLRWQWTRELSLDTTYRYVHLKRAADRQAAVSNALYLTLLHQWPKVAVSR